MRLNWNANIECFENSFPEVQHKASRIIDDFFLCINYNFLPTGSQPNYAPREWNSIKNRFVLFFMLCRAVLKLYQETNTLYTHTQTKYVFLGYITFAKLAREFLIRFGRVSSQVGRIRNNRNIRCCTFIQTICIFRVVFEIRNV